MSRMSGTQRKIKKRKWGKTKKKGKSYILRTRKNVSGCEKTETVEKDVARPTVI